MAFGSVTFPSYPMLHGVQKSVIDPVAIATNGTREYRVKRSRWERYSWAIPAQTMTTAQKESVKSFLVQRNHALNSFRYVDPDYPTLTNAIMSHNSGAFWNLALPFDSTTPGTHPIFNPIIGELSVTVNGSPGTINSFVITGGIPTIEVTGTTGTETIRVSGNLYFTVRLATSFSYALYALDCNNLPLGHQVANIELIEVYGEY